jgi:acetyl-CoA carboxylase biotin carboxylase subunit
MAQVTVRVAHDLDLDVARPLDVALDVEPPVAERLRGLAPGGGEALAQLGLVAHPRHALAPAAGRSISFAQEDVTFEGHAIECRINAEDPALDFRPTPGRLLGWSTPQGTDVRVDTHCHTGALVSPYYDSLLAKLIVRGADRASALECMQRALRRFRAEGVATTVPFHSSLVAAAEFAGGPVTTRWLEESFLPAWTREHT